MSTKAELLKKANALPLCPGVYIMRDRADKVIYVGKSAKLKIVHSDTPLQVFV